MPHTICLSTEQVNAHREQARQSMNHTRLAAEADVKVFRNSQRGSGKAMTRSYVDSIEETSSITQHVAVFEYADGSAQSFDGQAWKEHPKGYKRTSK